MDDRDTAADARDVAAEARDVTADDREAVADLRESEMDGCEAGLDASGAAPPEALLRTWQEARRERERHRGERDTAAIARKEAAQRRLDHASANITDITERAWAADKRDFVADERDHVADGRDTTADHRDSLADSREAELDERETDLVARSRVRAQREEARQERERRRADRDTAATTRNQATQSRAGRTSGTGLALAFAEIARHLYEAASLNDVLSRIAEASVATVPGCELASITVRDGNGAFRTPAATHPAAVAADQAQYEASEGPCLTAVEEAVVVAPAFPDPRWPALGARPAEAGVGSAVSFSLVPSGSLVSSGAGTLSAGALNAYARNARAFDDEAREIGLILAAHASVAVAAVGERDAAARLEDELRAALSSRDVIGQAKGILMERLRIPPEDAFDTLRHASQRLNVKLREVAQKLAESGELG